MTQDQTPDFALSFGSVAAAYDRGRPGYPADAAVWTTRDYPATVLELGAGTGKFTEQLVELGHDVYATDPDRSMLEILSANLPTVHTAPTGAEEIALPDRSCDAVVAAQSFHWFDLQRALPEIARVLKPGGRIGLVWNARDERIPWVRRLGALIGTQDQLREPAAALAESDLFGEVEETEFAHWQLIDRKSVQDLVLSRSNVAVLDEAAREAKLREVTTFYDDYGRGMDGMQLPYVTRCFRATVLDRPESEPDEPTAPEAARDDDTGSLLINFH